MVKLSLVLILVIALCGCTYVRVCDDQGVAVAGAKITYTKWSLIGVTQAGMTDADGDLTIGPNLPSIESITANKPGYAPSSVMAQDRDVIYLILTREGVTSPVLPPFLPP